MCFINRINFDFGEETDLFTSFKDIISQFNQFGLSHPQISSYGFGLIEDLTNDIQTKKEPLYTRFYVIPDVVNFNENMISLTFQVIIADIINATSSNQADILSDTILIFKDFYTLLNDSSYLTEGGIVLNPFLGEYETNLGGHISTININIPHNYNSCDLPIQFGNQNWEDVNKLWENVGTDWDKT